jgi:hypothetical protein
MSEDPSLWVITSDLLTILAVLKDHTHHFKRIMPALADIQAGIAQLTTDVNALIALAAPGAIPAAAGEAVAASLQALDATVQAAIAANAPAPAAPVAGS